MTTQAEELKENGPSPRRETRGDQERRFDGAIFENNNNNTINSHGRASAASPSSLRRRSGGAGSDESDPSMSPTKSPTTSAGVLPARRVKVTSRRRLTEEDLMNDEDGLVMSSSGAVGAVTVLRQGVSPEQRQEMPIVSIDMEHSDDDGDRPLRRSNRKIASPDNVLVQLQDVVARRRSPLSQQQQQQQQQEHQQPAVALPTPLNTPPQRLVVMVDQLRHDGSGNVVGSEDSREHAHRELRERLDTGMLTPARPAFHLAESQLSTSLSPKRSRRSAGSRTPNLNVDRVLSSIRRCVPPFFSLLSV